MDGGHLHRLFQVVGKVLPGLLRPLLVVHVIARQLDDPDAQVVGELNGLLHDLQAAPAHGGVAGSEGIFPVARQAHAADGHADLLHGLPQLVHSSRARRASVSSMLISTKS